MDGWIGFTDCGFFFFVWLNTENKVNENYCWLVRYVYLEVQLKIRPSFSDVRLEGCNCTSRCDLAMQIHRNQLKTTLTSVHRDYYSRTCTHLHGWLHMSNLFNPFSTSFETLILLSVSGGWRGGGSLDGNRSSILSQKPFGSITTLQMLKMHNGLQCVHTISWTLPGKLETKRRSC